MLVSLIMPTYNRDFIIELAIKSIINQKKNKSEIELLIGDDGNDATYDIVKKYINNCRIKVIYKKYNRIALSDKINDLVCMSSGEYYGIIGSDDMQSPYKIYSLEHALDSNKKADIFGQMKFIYHDIIYNKFSKWTQNRSLYLFKAGSFMINNRNIFDMVNGYDPGLWKRIDTSFYNKVVKLKPNIFDLSTLCPEIIDSSVAIQHFDNIWGRKAKGLLSKKNKQTTNFLAEPAFINISDTFPDLYSDYRDTKNRIIKLYKKNYPLKYHFRRLFHK